MRISRSTMIVIAVAIGVTAAGILLGLRTGQTFILAAIAAGVVSIYLQKKQPQLRASPKDDAEDYQASYQAAGSSLLEMRAQASTIENPDVRALALRITDQLSEALKHLDAPDRIAGAPLLVDQLLDPAQASITDYIWLSRRGVQPAEDLKTKIEQRDLPAFEHAARSVMGVVERPGPLDMTALRRAVSVHLADEADTALASSDPEAWGNRQRIIDQADRPT